MTHHRHAVRARGAWRSWLGDAASVSLPFAASPRARPWRAWELHPGVWVNLTPRPVTAQPTRQRVESGGERRAPRSPERRLYAAILATALDDLVAVPEGGAATRRAIERQRAATVAWIGGARFCPVPFTDCCEALDLDVDAARAALLDAAPPDRAALLATLDAAA